MLLNNNNKKGRIQIEPQSSANRPSNIWTQILVLVKFIVLEDLPLAGIKTTGLISSYDWVGSWLTATINLLAVTDW